MSDRKKTILAIDDNLAVLTTIQSILGGTFEISLAKNPAIAHTILNAIKVDLILLDVEMPGLSGMEFLEILHSSPVFYYIPVIIVSSRGTADVIINARKRGAVDFVVKPISADILIDKVQTGLKNTHLKINRIGLFTKIKALQNVLVNDQTNHVEPLINDLEHYSYNINIDHEVAELCRSARKKDYDSVAEKIRPLLLRLR